ncbi:hypothetical protein EUBSIR_02448 [[Eubacterium] siraeum DSM 15702]|uniref:Uncharacterized protein n=1 Tax=[Eubacterium] siraeum DSM 15702 TaxID=428128 RepID=B0MRH1_9FIRM|nr:hypothetical protein EUBSIR_02448 [[Eubacterium] siraeum DSM 15702]
MPSPTNISTTRKILCDIANEIPIVLPMSADKTKFSLDKTARICYNRFKAIY